ncbi:bifunctional UDP-N-acetylmuramoyl-tripeptide:D-alanyl-D-alanine ligase/alanine racemase [Bacteroides sp.]|uniref:bifunctional UDP-N-acetylmuramoyl-tripeptide:D-alanyl-D-alanine ligase/alanine racemase n=1 Tax=Bacteroides sp. TaxID=29523 RepID=UPI001B5D7E19|nr:bifunctional UDP-N-acetylmuramoyl-tripeptide:D-alanyl-D-alanine ligase/alanine racemase [Bacteroides sp.]MBP6064868.1 bifunctional UDP-N-acetylmuramoyl-tripeptide:D-alanyl-D-alanine ligase/alanine racemase [Bacteroides sp.]MBP6067721.1 bifunctional UDP-N-acetylmuramoyl-tripeptide:D-alanyl-D-alanine ligase/alanine racemase [Bacteroides sp.]MBP6935669.1 bifunctional UDP-N-acetylmuramoyl-tripeptide:D-alanyl-D-alanine ligase/alanine racemase [Bacteroides sp.]MBP8621523.1 bifunctional UDP-N-acety
MSYTIESIAKMIAAHQVGNHPATIDWLLTDSRSLNFPEETLFFALTTKRSKGAQYIPDLFDRGVRNFVVSTEDMETLQKSEAKRAKERAVAEQPEATTFARASLVILDSCNFLVVPHPLKALQKLAELHRDRFQIPVIGITGSNGKTIVKEWLHQLLSSDRIIARSPRSYNSQIGVPLSIWQMSEDAELGIFEAGISEVGEMRALHNMIKPTIGILTNIGGAHQENFFSMQEKCMEKLSLFKNCDVVIYNGDNDMICNCVSKSMLTAREIAWSCRDADRPLFISKIQKKEDHTVIAYRYLGMDNSFCLPFIDDASIENSFNCLAACLYLMTPADQISERMVRLEPIAMRLEVKEGKNNCILINDSYNSDLGSLDIALDFLYRRSESKGLKRTLILSDILESGQSTSTLYRKVAQLVQSRGIDKIIGVGPEISSCEARFEGVEKYFFTTTKEFLTSEVCQKLKDEVILIKGSRSFHFDLVSEELELKVHETILEVNLGAMIENLNHYRSMLRPETKVACMVKASAYGAGSYEIAKTLQEHHVDYLAVAVADEGAELRKAGITGSIIIMNPELSAFKTMFDYKLEPEVYNFHLLDALIKSATKEGITNFPIHVKLDTGMHRLGFDPTEMPYLIRKLKNQHSVIPRSVFSHFVGSDSAQFDAFTHNQINQFKQASEELQAIFPHKILRHICNTAGIQRFPEAQFDMVRLGLGLYGVNPVDNSMMRNVSTLRTTILQIREVSATDTVGYSRKGLLDRPSRIAAIPIGYADGLNRHLGCGKGYCLVNGQKAPYVGNICMDVCMIDVTEIECREGDQAIIFGDELPITVLSDILETIPYEVLTGISARVKRVYYQD